MNYVSELDYLVVNCEERTIWT